MVINDKTVLQSSWQTKIFKSRCIKIVFNNEEKKHELIYIFIITTKLNAMSLSLISHIINVNNRMILRLKMKYRLCLI